MASWFGWRQRTGELSSNVAGARGASGSLSPTRGKTRRTLTTVQRIRNRPEFERVYKQGIRVHGRFMTLFVLVSDRPARRLGVAATRKIGSAVDRNRAKRLAREIFRRTNSAAGLDIVVVPRREMLDAPFASLESDYERALQRALPQTKASTSSATGRRGRSGAD